MRFEDAYEGWTEQRLTQIDAARLLGDGNRATGGLLPAGIRKVRKAVLRERI